MKMNEILKQKELDEDRLDEILPLITGAASLAGGAMSLAGGVASGVGAAAKGIGKGIGAVAKGVGSVAKGVGKTIGTVASIPGKIIGGDDEEDPRKKMALDKAKDAILRPGQAIKLPTPKGDQEFKVTKITGDEVEIENPEGNKSPNQPNKITYYKDDLKKSMSI